jgi:hypothetical protein
MWTATDPIGIRDGINVYCYGRCNPISHTDPNGMDCTQIVASTQPNTPQIICTEEPYPGGSIPKASLSGPSGLKPKSSPSPTTTLTPKPTPKAGQPQSKMSDADSMQNLKTVTEQLQLKLTYPKEITHAMGVAQTLGGVLELGAAVYTVETGVGPMLLGAHGLDTIQTGLRTAWTGEQQRSGVFYAGSGAAFLFSNDPKLASAVGFTADMGANLAAGAYSLKIAPSPTIALSPEAELDLELSQLANLQERPRFTVDFDLKWKDIGEGVLGAEGYKLNPKLINLESLLTPTGKIGGKNFGGVYMFVVDEEGTIRIGTRVGRQHMPHPTLIGGSEPTVMAAGEVDIRAGQIYSVNNLSGHFRPSPGSLGAMYSAFSGLPNTAFKSNFIGFRAFYF